MTNAALDMPSINTSCGWFICEQNYAAIDLEGSAHEGRIAGVSFNQVLAVYKAAGHKMMVLETDKKSPLYGVKVEMISEFHDPRVLKDFQGQQSAITFKNPSWAFAGFGVEISVANLIRKLSDQGYGKNFLRLEKMNDCDDGRTFSVIHFTNDIAYAADTNGFTAIYLYGPDARPLFVSQTPDQIKAALDSGVPFAIVPLPEIGPSPRDAATDRRVQGIADLSKSRAHSIDHG